MVLLFIPVAIVIDIIFFGLFGASLSVFWGWYIADLGTLGLGSITAAQGVGIAFIVAFLRYKNPDKTEEDIWETLATSTITKFFALALFWLLAVALLVIV